MSNEIKPHHVHHDLIIAWAKGANIQTMGDHGEWKDVKSPLWGYDMVYRIRPNIVKKWRWVTRMSDSYSITRSHYANEEEYSVKNVHTETKFVQKIDETEIEVEE